MANKKCENETGFSDEDLAFLFDQFSQILRRLDVLEQRIEQIAIATEFPGDIR